MFKCCTGRGLDVSRAASGRRCITLNADTASADIDLLLHSSRTISRASSTSPGGSQSLAYDFEPLLTMNVGVSLVAWTVCLRWRPSRGGRRAGTTGRARRGEPFRGGPALTRRMVTLLATLGLLGLGLVALVVLVRVTLWRRARALLGTPAPRVIGPIGKRVAGGQPLLVYFHTPGCAACRPFTPRLSEMSRRNPAVQVVDMSRQLDVARAFGVLATPTTIEIAEGKIVGYQLGPLPPALLERFA